MDRAIFERACDIEYAIDHYESALEILRKPYHSLKVVFKKQQVDDHGKTYDVEKVIDNAATDFIREMIEEHTDKLMEEIQAKIDKLEKEIDEL